MKLPINSFYQKTILIIGSLGLQLLCLAVAQAGPRDPLYLGIVRPGLDYRSEPAQGYLTVYSATDRFDDGGVPYYPHSSYSIYTTDGKFLKRVENHVSFSDEAPDVVKLAVGSYTVEARSESEGYLRIHIVVRPGVQTVLGLDGQHTDTQDGLAKSRHPRSVANR